MAKTPPAEFSILHLYGEFIGAGINEWHGPCPKCGGTDRFVIFTDKQFPHWNFFCRSCHPENGWIDEWWPALKENRPISPAEYTAMKLTQVEQQKIDLQAQIDKAQLLISELNHAETWLQYHAQLTDESRELWASWGVPDFFQEYWQLGYDPNHTIYTSGMSYSTATMTIPIFEAKTWNVLNIRHRLLNPQKPGDKYRPERSGLPAALFVAEPDLAIANRTILVEGEKKAMVTFVTADNPDLQVVGIPGKNPSDELIKKLENCDPLYICLDPDARRESYELSKKIGKSQCRIIELPDKIDDLIIKNQLTKYWINNVLRQATKA